MSKIAISLDSACDLTKELIEKFDFKIIPFGVTMGDRFFYDGEVDGWTGEGVWSRVDGNFCA